MTKQQIFEIVCDMGGTYSVVRRHGNSTEIVKVGGKGVEGLEACKAWIEEQPDPERPKDVDREAHDDGAHKYPME